MFRGVQTINMDAKGRLAIPTRQRERLRELCDGDIVVTVDTDSTCLVIYPLPEWERIEAEVRKLPTLKPGVKRFRRLLLGYATDLKLDGNGRILVPPSLREYARLEKGLVLVGQGPKLELWSETLWEAELARESDEALPEELLSLDL